MAWRYKNLQLVSLKKVLIQFRVGHKMILKLTTIATSTSSCVVLLDDDEGVGVVPDCPGHADGVQEGGQDELHLGRDPGSGY